MHFKFDFTILISLRPQYPLGVPLSYFIQNFFVFGAEGRFRVSPSKKVWCHLYMWEYIHGLEITCMFSLAWMMAYTTLTCHRRQSFSDIMPWGINNRQKLIKPDPPRNLYLFLQIVSQIWCPFSFNKLYCLFSRSPGRGFLTYEIQLKCSSQWKKF